VIGRCALAVALALGAGCAGSFTVRGPAGAPVALDDGMLSPAAAKGWRALAAGDLAAGDRAFAEAITSTGADGPARFGRMSLAFERGRDSEALSDGLTLLESAATAPAAPEARDRSSPAGRALTAALADATAARLHELMDEVVDPRPFEDRLLALRPAALPWRAQLAIEDAVDLVARRRGDATALAARSQAAGCLTEGAWVAVAGRLPHVDLMARARPLPAALPLRASGCRLWLPPRDGWPGVKVLRLPLPPSELPRQLVLDFEGPAAVALLDADGHPIIPAAAHESEAVFGPRAGAVDLPPTKAGSAAEIRLGTFGGAVDLRLFLVAAAPTHAVTATSPAATALVDLANLLAADAAGETDRALGIANRIAARGPYSLGLAAAASVLAADPSRPAALARAEADGLLRRALAASPGLVRSMRALASAELGHGRGADAAQLAEQALAAHAGYWPAAVTLIEAQRSRGLERPADLTLDRAMTALGARAGGCPVVQLAYERARGRHRLADEQTLLTRLSACDARLTPEVEWHAARGEPQLARTAFARKEGVTLDPTSYATEAATLDLAAGDARSASGRLRASVFDRLRDPALRVRFVDSLLAGGDTAGADAALTDTIRWFPSDANVAKLARLRGLPLPMAAYHRDGRAVIADFRAENRAYAAPAVLVLDRTVMRVLDDGASIILTHNIVNVKTKDGITRWGEVAVPPGAEILALRTHKADGSTREPEDISGKETISAPDLAPGDFVEWETIEYRAAADGLAPGFIAERFYFQSVELPLHLSELLLVVPPALQLALDARAGAPAPVESRAADGARELHFTARHMPQLFAERAAVRPEEWIPSLRASAALALPGYVATLRDNLYGVARGSPTLRAEAARIASAAGSDPRARVAAIVRWVMDHIEAEPNLYETATGTLARGRGNRAGLIVGLARALGIDAGLALARPLGTAAPGDAPVPQELDDFSDLLVRFPGLDGRATVYLDPRYEHAALGYLPPGIDGAATLNIDTGQIEIARSHFDARDQRRVAVDLALDATGAASGTVVEELRGWPAIEWAAFAKEWGDDSRKLRQEFEQRWLGQQFPGARLGGLAIDVDRTRPGEARLRYAVSDFNLGGAAEDDDAPPPVAGTIAAPFFRASPGRRFATLSSRRTPMLLGPDIPLSLVARLELPAGAKVDGLGRGGKVQVDGLSFEESRTLIPGDRPVIEIRRNTVLPLLRVTPAAYQRLGPELRRIDAFERAEIHFSLPAQAGQKGAKTGR
jgi:hypothetical protein